MNVSIDLDNDIEYAGDTEQEKKLNKDLINTTLELNFYQDSYDEMKTVDDLKAKVEEMKGLSCEEYIPDYERGRCTGWVQALTWALNNSKTKEEKLASLPKASKEQVAKVIDSLHKRYEQLSLFSADSYHE